MSRADSSAVCAPDGCAFCVSRSGTWHRLAEGAVDGGHGPERSVPLPDWDPLEAVSVSGKDCSRMSQEELRQGFQQPRIRESSADCGPSLLNPQAFGRLCASARCLPAGRKTLEGAAVPVCSG